MLENALDYCHLLLKRNVANGDLVIDATVGNGNDTVLLATLVGSAGKVIGFDIQEQAIQNTTTKLMLTGLLERVTLYQQGHETIREILPSVDRNIGAAVFNLGYLPKGDKQIITRKETTLAAIKHILPKLRTGGLLLLVVYSGHPGGQEEKEGVLDYVARLEQREFDVLQYGFINQRNTPPFLIAIERKK